MAIASGITNPFLYLARMAPIEREVFHFILTTRFLLNTQKQK